MDLLDFSIPFVVDPRSDSSGEESESESESNDDDSFHPTKARKLGTSHQGLGRLLLEDASQGDQHQTESYPGRIMKVTCHPVRGRSRYK